MTQITVYADWDGLENPRRLGFLHARHSGAREFFEFEYDRTALADPQLNTIQPDPRITLFEGRPYPEQGRETFGMLADSSPDRWGRMLMSRRLEREKRAGNVSANARLFESDFLLGVHDAYRVGALRFKRNDEGPFLDDHAGMTAPPMIALSELEHASRSLEQDEDNTAANGNDWLRMLIAPAAHSVAHAPRPAWLIMKGNFG